ncbi:protein FAM163A [Callorhinchus milii]|uniref:Family with sequence similarity 163 member Ab n=1 Tax=Callorhinchus milii TaxID=7868 RepID=A0A4W3H369_CALMI|nr:protein FAM163A [Callorhinchus milii]XP_042191650.1 protein FAM163A [Callorhinchus milii]|eukprot:gi/632969651/ref/XP_007901197.1/ PREDICTED: protein FAM163A [Callorhinchus milii]
MTAGTVVITGGILATVILLSIITVLCYCRLQYYCCKKDESDDEEEDSDFPNYPHFPCNACGVHVVDGSANEFTSPLEPSQTATRKHCPGCSPRHSPFYIRTTDDMRNGGERVTYTPTRYKQPGMGIKMSTLQSFPMNQQSFAQDTFANVRAISTEV